MMDWMQKERLCRVAYWTIFIIVPTAAVTFVGAWSHPRIGWTLPVFEAAKGQTFRAGHGPDSALLCDGPIGLITFGRGVAAFTRAVA